MCTGLWELPELLEEPLLPVCTGLPPYEEELAPLEPVETGWLARAWLAAACRAPADLLRCRLTWIVRRITFVPSAAGVATVGLVALLELIA